MKSILLLLSLVFSCAVQAQSYPGRQVKVIIPWPPGQATDLAAHMFAELFNPMAKLQALHIPYKGSVPALTDVMGGQVAYAIETVASPAPTSSPAS